MTADVIIPATMFDDALGITKERLKANRDNYKGTHRDRSGHTTTSILLGPRTPLDLHVDMMGVLAELVVRQWAKDTPDIVDYQCAPLVEDIGTHGADITLTRTNGAVGKVNVKGCEYEMRVNCEAHRKNMGLSDYYLFVIFDGPARCRLRWVKYDEVTTWRTDLVFSWYFWKGVKE